MAGFGLNTIPGSIGFIGSAIGDGLYNVTHGQNDWTQTINAANSAWNVKKPAAPSVPAYTPPKSPVSANLPNGNDAWAKESAALNAQLAALQYQMAQAPRLPNFDILANYNRAKATATTAVNPLYDKKLNLFLEGQGIKKTEKTNQFGLQNETADMTLRNTLGDNATGRVRAGEDLAGALDAISTNRDRFLVDDAAKFDQERRALQESVAGAGGTDTGLGQQAIGQAQDDRNLNAGRTMEDMQKQESAKKLFTSRTIEDFATSDVRAGEKTALDKKGNQMDFDTYMASLANEENQYRLQNDLDRALEIARQTESNNKQGVSEFIAGLAGSGARAQDIALAKQVYM